VLAQRVTAGIRLHRHVAGCYVGDIGDAVAEVESRYCSVSSQRRSGTFRQDSSSRRPRPDYLTVLYDHADEAVARHRCHAHEVGQKRKLRAGDEEDVVDRVAASGRAG